MEDQSLKCLTIQGISTHSPPITSCYFERGQQCHLVCLSKEDNYTCRRWRQVQFLSNVFWLLWTREYLPSLQQRQKWTKPQCNLAVNDIVLLLDENMPRSLWPLARVLEVYSNPKDGLVRSAKVKTRTSVLVRPVDKIVLLEAAQITSKD